MIVKTEAIVLQTRKFGDTSKIAVLFTKDYGRISVIAKGALKPKSKFGSSLDPMCYISVTIYKKNAPGLHLLSSAELVKPLRKIHKSAEHLYSGFMILESVSKTASENDDNPELFSLLLNSMIMLNDISNNAANIFIYFELNLFRILGFEINFNGSDNESGNVLNFSLNNASVINGYENAGRTYKIDKKNWLYLKKMYITEFENIGKVEFETKSFGIIYDFLMNYLGFHLERPFNLKSRSLLML